LIEVLLNFKNNLVTQAFYNLLKNLEDFIPCIAEEKICKDPEIILTDFFSLNSEILSNYPKAKVVLVDTGIKPNLLLRAMVQHKLSGIIALYTDLELFKKALKVIKKGEIWIDNKYLKQLVNNLENLKEKRLPLTPKEKEIISLVCKGLSNKQIADKLNISEQTVKAHLNRIFRKLNVQSRTQLVSIFLEINHF
jgi:DNA-binding NarL/FixJ family response regulator